MISFRTHVATLVAVFLALAVGVVLGGGPLSDLGRGTDENTAALKDRLDETETIADFGNDFVADTSDRILAGALKGRQVAMVTLPGAKASTVDALREAVGAAGGTVTAVQELGSSLVNPAEKGLVESLTTQMLSQVPAGSVSGNATTYERAGELIALTLSTTETAGATVRAEAGTVSEGLVGANLLPQAAEVTRLAPLVLVVSGDEVSGDGGDAILSGLVRGLSRRSVGTVVVSDTSERDDQMDRVRRDDAWGAATSVDGAEQVVGQTTAVLALARSFDTQGGNFGATGSDGTVPLR
ncbi:copper transporter [Nocardioides yefusunii]|uniref:Copper transporter n=1 Tax=Nocardioides yefusunii TaxID=2500546 RepID=A0ABW1R1W9_9ACTN|nr:copper transporter [Nocardioides yefusunii]